MPARAAAVSSGLKDKRKRYHKRERPLKPKLTEAEKLAAQPNVGCGGHRGHDKCAKAFAQLRDNGRFQGFIIGVIVVAGVLVGMSTYDLDDDVIEVTLAVDEVILVIFIGELVVKFAAEGKYPHRFFFDAWNVFDFLIVVVGLMPFAGSAVTALRLVRLLRVLKLVRALPKLRILVMGLLKSMSSIAYIGLLLMLLFYLFAVSGVDFFGKNDPVHFSSLHVALITLFRSATLEDWTDVMYINIFGCDNYGYDSDELMELCLSGEPTQNPVLSVMYFVVFIILSSMMILNLFIGVITGSMQDAQTELVEEAAGEYESEEDEDILAEKCEELADCMSTISNAVEQLQAEEAQKAEKAAELRQIDHDAARALLKTKSASVMPS